MSHARYNAATGGKFSGKLRDADGVVIPLANLTTFELTLKNPITGAVINSRNAQNIKNLNNVTVDTSSGGFIWDVRPEDVTITGDFAEYVAEFYGVHTPGSKAFRHIHRLLISRQGWKFALCSFDDVADYREKMAVADALLVERMIDACTVASEKFCQRVWKKTTVAAPGVEYFSPFDNQRSIQTKHWPIDQVVSLKESISGDFASATAVDAADIAHFDNVVRLRFGQFWDGARSVELKVAGGLATDLSDVPWDLRDAIARQVAYMHSRKASIGVSSESSDNGAVTTFSTGRWLPEVETVLRSYRSAVPA